MTAYQSGGGIVYLNPGVYNIDGQIRIGSNTKLTGNPNTLIRVSSSSSQWFPDGTGIIEAIDNLNNVEICGFQIDGNCENLPTDFANSGPGDHDAERLIDFRCDSGNFGTNISIHDMKIYDAYSDGFHIAFAHGVYCYNNFFSNCQHDAVFYIDVVGGEIYNNRIEGITDDCIRFDNCQLIKIHDNLLYTYKGSNNHGSFEDGANGIQGGDEGFSHGGGSSKPDFVDSVEIYNNLIENMGLAGIQLDTTGQNDNERVLIHHNTIVNCGYESNAQWGAGIAFDPWVSGIDIQYNTIDNCFQAAILVLRSIGSCTATIANNNILNTQGNGQSSGGLSSSLCGYGINNLASEMDLTINNNYFSGNLKGNSNVPCSNNAISMIAGAGGNGSSVIGNLPGIPRVNQTGATVPEKITSIFDILNMTYSDKAVDGGNSYIPNFQMVTKGKVSGGIDIVGFHDMVQIDGQNYIKRQDDTIISSDAQNLAFLSVSTQKETSLSRNGNNLTANLRVNIKYDTVSTISSLINGKSVKKNNYNEHSETEEFSSSPVEIPNIYNGSAVPVVNVTIYNNSYNSQTRFYVPITPFITKISYEYNNSTSWYYIKVGEILSTPKNVEYVNFKDMGYWDNANDTSYIAGLFVIPKAIDPNSTEQVKITLYDVYGNAQNVTDYQVTDYNEDLTKAINPYTYLIFAFLLILFSGTLIIVKGVILRRR